MLESNDSIGKACRKLDRFGSGVSRNELHLFKVMNSSQLQPENSEIVEVNCWEDRWQIYKRLQELDIPSWCGLGQPLRVQINNTSDGIQLSSVLQQFSSSRQELVSYLKRCWSLKLP